MLHLPAPPCLPLILIHDLLLHTLRRDQTDLTHPLRLIPNRLNCDIHKLQRRCLQLLPTNPLNNIHVVDYHLMLASRVLHSCLLELPLGNLQPAGAFDLLLDEEYLDRCVGGADDVGEVLSLEISG